MTPKKATPRRRVSARPRAGPRTSVGVVGLGHVGIAMAVAFAKYGHPVVGYDVVRARREEVAKGTISIFDPGLAPLLAEQVALGRLTVAPHVGALVQQVPIVFLCVPTPSRPDGSVSLDFLEAVARDLAPELTPARGWRTIVVKSTAPPGTAEHVGELLAKGSGRRLGADFGVAANPEFLAEGSLVKDALEPSRIALGCAEERSRDLLLAAYEGFPSPRVVLPIRAAELVKYSSNALLAVKVSFANEIARLAEKVGADVYPVMEGVGLDPRLGASFLKAGPGFGGSCFPKDLQGLVAFARSQGLDLPVTRGALEVNETQGRHVVELLEHHLGALAGKQVAVLGLAFKADTDDVRESRAYPILGDLVKRGALVRLHDPRALEVFQAGLPPLLASGVGRQIRFVEDLEEAVTGADAALIQCDWREYRDAPLSLWRSLARGGWVVDARRSVDGEALQRAGIRYAALGRGEAPVPSPKQR